MSENSSKKAPLEPRHIIRPLAVIWDEVVDRIISELMDLVNFEDAEIHIDMREEIVLTLAQIHAWMSEVVVVERINNRPLHSINIELEREECLGLKGAKVISGTAHVLYKSISKKITERWEPKSQKIFERERNPRKRNPVSIQPVKKNHFIPKFFLKSNWANNEKLLCWRCTENGWKSSSRNFGQWGSRKNLYSDKLEAYFGLLEGDAKQPIRMLLNMCPLNDPQRKAFVGFLIIQMLRNPSYMEAFERGIAPVVIESGYYHDPTMVRRAYESIFQNNDLYDHFARPIMWSQWAIVKSDEPVFVLPDTFSIHNDLGDGLRMIVPLTPNYCFVTLLDREKEKRLVPHPVSVNNALARRISATLISQSISGFVSHPDFKTTDTSPVKLKDLLSDIFNEVTTKIYSWNSKTQPRSDSNEDEPKF